MRSHYGPSGADGAPGGRAIKHPGGGPVPPQGLFRYAGGGREGRRRRNAEGRQGRRPEAPEGGQEARPQGAAMPQGAHSQRAHTAEDGRAPLIVTGTPPRVASKPSCEV